MDELEVKSLALDKPHFKSLAFKDTWNPYKILVSLSLRDRVKCGVLGWKGEGGQFRSLRGGFKKKIMKFSIKLAGWVLDDPIFYLKKNGLKTLYFA